VSSHCFFSIREVASAAMIASDTQAMTDVSDMGNCRGGMQSALVDGPLLLLLSCFHDKK
jgi:hypothetical protein